MDIASEGKWDFKDGYIQTCPWNVQKCWQNFVYFETVKGAFEQWNPDIITDSEWLMLEEGK